MQPPPTIEKAAHVIARLGICPCRPRVLIYMALRQIGATKHTQLHLRDSDVYVCVCVCVCV
jgi:hypothetical protein